MRVLKTNVRRWLVAVWTACAALGAGGATYYVIDLSDGANASYYPLEILDGEPAGGWTDAHKTTKLVLRRIEPGTFMMCNQVSVTLTRPFFIGAFEVTQKQYELVTGKKPSSNQGDKLPVESVSWNDIRGDCNWPTETSVSVNSFMGLLRARTGLAFDLPTEAQWEYACRAGTTTDFNDGTNLSNSGLDELGRYEGNGGDERGGSEYLYTTTTVGSYLPNAWGLYDMHGNVEEWCLDYFGDLVSGNDPQGPETGGNRVYRGGGYDDSASGCGSSWRSQSTTSPANMRAPDIGFRVICYPAEIVQSVTPYEGTYDGEGHGIAVDVTMPPTADISYAHSEAGPYQAEPILITNATAGAVTVWYKVEATGYDTVISNSTVTISKATYDMSGVAWDYVGPFEGDGAVKTVTLTNLPAGVTASYKDNTATRPGTYTAQATLTYDTTNYEPPLGVADLIWTITEPIDLAVDSIIGYPVTVGSDSAGVVEGISDASATGLRSVKMKTSDNHEAWFEVVVTNALSVSFDWKCSCEPFSKGGPWDYLMFSVDGTRRDYICGETDWTNVTFSLNGEGVQALRWTYSKDDRDAVGNDCAWVANVIITFAHEPELRFTSVSVTNGVMTVAVSVTEGEISSAKVKNMLEATSDLSDWAGGALPITVTDLTQGVAQTVRFRVTFQSAVPRAFLRVRSDGP